MTNKSEPAFPTREGWTEDTGKYREDTGGLTKREYFAAMAMQGMITCPDYEGCEFTVSKLAVEYADALIEELNK